MSHYVMLKVCNCVFSIWIICCLSKYSPGLADNIHTTIHNTIVTYPEIYNFMLNLDCTKSKNHEDIEYGYVV